MASIQSARSDELMSLHSFLTFGLVHAPLAEVNKRVEMIAMRRTLRKAILELRDQVKETGN